MSNTLKRIADLEISRPEELSKFISGLQSDSHNENNQAQWIHEFAASGKTCQVVGIHEPTWAEKLPSCDKSGKVTDQNQTN